MEALGLLMTNWEVKYLYKINVQKKQSTNAGVTLPKCFFCNLYIDSTYCNTHL